MADWHIWYPTKQVAPFWIVVMRRNEIIKFDYWSNKQLKKDIVEFLSFKICREMEKGNTKDDFIFSSIIFQILINNVINFAFALLSSFGMIWQ